MTRVAATLRRLIDIPFSPQQLDAITAPLGPGVIVAGAGSGKTTVMAARVVWLVATGQVQPDEVLGLTFTNKSAAQLRSRVRKALRAAGPAPPSGPSGAAGEAAEEPTVSTYHAFASRLIAEHGLRLGVEPGTRVLADASRFQLADLTIRRSPGPFHQLWTHRPTLVSCLLALDDQLNEHLVTVEAVRAFDRALAAELAEVASSRPVQRAALAISRREELLVLVEQHREAKRQRGVMDFADQMAFGAAIAERCPEVGAVERARYRVVLLDEYQDTSVAQRRMLVGLFAGKHGLGHPVTAVGDPCQSIYGWRGASVENLDEFPSHFPTARGAPAPVFPLNVNRRCGRTILAAANRHAAALYDVHSGVRPLSAPDGADDGEISVALHQTYREEIEWVADEVVRTHAADPEVPWSEIGVLVHDNADIGALHDALVLRHVPVEVMGVGGLLALPEVSDVVATLEVIADQTANAALLRLLAGPRWRIGPRDLALLGRRARSLAVADRPGTGCDSAAGLEQALVGVDQTELVSLADALESPGTLPYSDLARERFRLLAEELRRLRSSSGEPLADLVRRVVETTGVDVELAASGADLAAVRRDNLSSFVDAVAAFAGVDGAASLSGLLAYLRAEDEYGQGLAVCVPTGAESVKLLTVHKAKGLEWDAVFLPAMVESVFPSARGRPRWVTAPQELPGPLRGDRAGLPEVPEWSDRGLSRFTSAARAQEMVEERRLGYVALTRARRRLVASGHWWGPTQARPRGPSDYLRELAAFLRELGEQIDVWAGPPEPDAANPALEGIQERSWPEPPDPAALVRHTEADTLVRQARQRFLDAGRYDSADDRAALGADELARVEQWDLELGRLVAEVRADQGAEVRVPLPTTMSTTQALRLSRDPGGLARELSRPMPRRPDAAARLGIRFHAWVESFVGQQRLLDAADLPGAVDEGLTDDGDLVALCESFATGPYGHRTPHLVEAPFALVLGRQVVRGRIDAVYATDGGYEVVDWKTAGARTADPLQLAIYRLALAELTDVPVDRVQAAFYFVRSGEVVRPPDLPGRSELERLFTAAAHAGAEPSPPAR